MFNQYRPPSSGQMPAAVKNLLIINGLFFLVNFVLIDRKIIDLSDYLGLYFPLSPHFKPYQFITYMFMHGDIFHIFFNMLSLYMFGATIENYWGWKKFSVYYFVTALGGAVVYLLVKYFQIHQLQSEMPYGLIQSLSFPEGSINYQNGLKLYGLINNPVIGASGAVYGVLLAFGLMFPNTELMMLMFPVPVKAKYLVFIMAGLELLMGINNAANDNVAHFAHLGGMLFGFILIKFWNKTNRKTFY